MSQVRTYRPHYRSLRLVASVGLSLALIVTACGSSSSEVDQSTPADTSASAPDSGAAETALIPTADGGQLDWGSLDGQDVVLWFWAPW